MEKTVKFYQNTRVVYKQQMYYFACYLEQDQVLIGKTKEDVERGDNLLDVPLADIMKSVNHHLIFD